jgi:aryl-alcohol dehydrogenase
MKITAAVVHERSGPFNVEQVDLCDPRADELLVEVIASGMCATDMHGRDAYYPTIFPKVFGHEGAGVVRAVGSGVTKFKTGDQVVMAYPWCGECPNCKTQRQCYCLHAFDLKMNGTRADGSTLHSKNG